MIWIQDCPDLSPSLVALLRAKHPRNIAFCSLPRIQPHTGEDDPRRLCAHVFFPTLLLCCTQADAIRVRARGGGRECHMRNCCIMTGVIGHRSPRVADQHPRTFDTENTGHRRTDTRHIVHHASSSFAAARAPSFFCSNSIAKLVERWLAGWLAHYHA